MNGLKLGVNQASFYDSWNRVIGMNKFFQVTQRTMHFFNRWWNKTGIIRPCAANPVLALAKFTRIGKMGSACFLHELFMQFADKPKRHWEIVSFHSFNTVVQRFDIMQNIINIVWYVGSDFGLGCDGINHSGSRSLNLAGSRRVFSQIHQKKEI